MITRSSATYGTTTVASEPCPCGCAPCDKQCCDLECLVRPRFFCGQLLTDADLTALVEWSRARFRLARHRHGWGVACGLEVSRDPKNPAAVLINPGYAIDCCGNDIVVCEPASHSLSGTCPQTECYDARSDRRRSLEQARRRASTLLIRTRDLAEEQQKKLQQSIETVQEALKAEDLDRLLRANEALETRGKKLAESFARPEYAGLFGEQLNNAQAVDLFLHYDEQGAEPQSTLRAGACGSAECQDSRTREKHRLSVRIVVGQAARSSDWDDWTRRYNKHHALAQTFVKQIEAATRAGDLKSVCAALTSWLNNPDHAAGQIFFARDRAKEICANVAMPDETWVRDLPEVVFWLIVDDLIAWLACGCPSCDLSDGIPLARVWLRGAELNQPCRIVAIDSMPPHRRLLRRDDCLPARPNQVRPGRPGVNIGDLLGRRWEEVQAEMRARGFDDEISNQEIALHGWDGVQRILAITPEALAPYSNTTLQALIVNFGDEWGRRFVGFQEFRRT